MNDWLFIGLFACSIIVALALFALPLRNQFKVSGLLTLPVFITLILAAYWQWGGFTAWQAYRNQQLKQQQAEALLKTFKTPAELAAKLRAQLDDSPASARGWFLLGKLLASQQQWQEASHAFAKAHQFKPQNEQFTLHYIESLWQLNNQQFNDQTRKLLTELMQKNKNQPDAIAMAAMDAFQNKHYQLAINYWRQLLKSLPATSADTIQLQKAIAKAQLLKG